MGVLANEEGSGGFAMQNFKIKLKDSERGKGVAGKY